MSRAILGALLAAVAFAFSSTTQAESDKESKPTNPGFASPEDIEVLLDSPLKSLLQFSEIPINEVMNHLQEEYQIPIVFDSASMEEVAISPETEVTLNLRNITLRSALNLMLRQPGLEDITYIIDDEVLMITTKEEANSHLVIAVYQVDDLIDNGSPRKKGEKSPYTSLVKVITDCVEHDSWMANGTGEGVVHLMKPGILVVSQTKAVQDKIATLLKRLRSASADISRTQEANRAISSLPLSPNVQ
jgi:hypothetical protein